MCGSFSLTVERDVFLVTYRFCMRLRLDWLARIELLLQSPCFEDNRFETSVLAEFIVNLPKQVHISQRTNYLLMQVFVELYEHQGVVTSQDVGYFLSPK
jgi:hypothetical protein